MAKHSTIADAAAEQGVSIRTIQTWIAGARSRKVVIDRFNSGNKGYVDGQAWSQYSKAYPKRIQYDIVDGILLVGSDIHIWPGYESTAQRAFVGFCKELRPSAIVLNGDIFDFAGISRHHRIGWS